MLTHHHIDHVGLLYNIKKNVDSKIFFSKNETELLDTMFSYPDIYSKNIVEVYVRNGVPDDIAQMIKKINKMSFNSSFSKSYRLLTRPDIILTDGDKISTENYSFKIILTPGHSPGHICLYETNFKFLIAGDHILPKITPNIIPYKEDSNPLYDYF